MTPLEALRSAPRRLQQMAKVPSRPLLRAIRTPARRLPGLPFALLVVAIVVLGMIGLLTLTTTLQDQGFAVRGLQTRAAELSYRVSDLETQVHRAASPAEIAGRATELGMVPNPNGVFIDLATGRVVGEAKPVTGQEIPSLRVPRPAAAIDPTQLQKVVTSVRPWFDLDGVQPPAPTEPPPADAAAPAGGSP